MKYGELVHLIFLPLVYVKPETRNNHEKSTFLEKLGDFFAAGKLAGNDEMFEGILKVTLLLCTKSL